jgi:predicted PurR-regulated permease PerM
MNFLRWLGGIVVFFWLLGLIFKFAGVFIHLLLIAAAIIFIVDWVMQKSKNKKIKD